MQRPHEARSFGLPRPEESATVARWLRLKGVRDIVSGLAVLALMARGASRAVGIVLLVEAIIPVGDMLLLSRQEARRGALSAFMARPLS